jgi:arylsulfatase
VATRVSLLTGLYPQQIKEPYGHHLQRGRSNVTIAEVLKTAGYRTLLSGKWHNGAQDGERPVNRGFDRFWGLLSGGGNHFNPGLPRPGEPAPVHKTPGNERPWGDDDTVIFPFTPEDRDFYVTDAYTDRAVDFLDRYGADDAPFFLYIPHCAPHFPMQAWEEDIARYEGTYMEGWDRFRERRYARLVELGLIDERWGVSERDTGCPSWSETNDKKRWDRRMAVYAAMIDRLDQGVGKVMEKIRALGKEENTLVIFLSDNGGCAGEIDNTPDKLPGGRDTYTTVGAPWANVSNTPFRKYKIFDHEGGISTPLIASWPAAIEARGAITHEIGHVMDFLPTFTELAGAEYPVSNDGCPVLPCEGRSLAPTFKGQERDGYDTLFWELRDCRAIRKGKWKLVTLGPERTLAQFHIKPDRLGWELYDIESDRCELNDLSSQFPDVVAELELEWNEWFRRCERQREGDR